MPDVLLSTRSTDAVSALRQCGVEGGLLTDRTCRAASQALAYTPYLIGDDPQSHGQLILGELAAGNAARTLTGLTACFGSDNVKSLAAFQEKFEEFKIGVIGTASSVYTDRTSAFVKAVEDHQKALLHYRQTARSGSPLTQHKRLQAQRTFDKLQVSFRNEMRILNAQVASRRGTPLSNFERGVNIARDSRHADKLFIKNQAEAHSLVRLTRHAKVLGNGLAVIDFGSRVGRIHSSYQAGGNWHREMFVQSLSFTASAGASVLTVKGGLLLFAVFTPVGLVGLLAGGAAIAAVAAAGAVIADGEVKAQAGDWYDDIMAWLGAL